MDSLVGLLLHQAHLPRPLRARVIQLEPKGMARDIERTAARGSPRKQGDDYLIDTRHSQLVGRADWRGECAL